MSLQPNSLHITSLDGLKLNVLEWSRKGIPCLLIHGLGDSSCIWHDVAPAFAVQFRTLAIDLRGHGDSDWDPDLNYDVATLMRDVTSIMVAFNVDRIHVVGHSLGGEVALRFAAANPERVLGLVLVDFGPELNPCGVDHINAELDSTPRLYRSIDEYTQRLAERHALASSAIVQHIAIKTLSSKGAEGFELKRDPRFGEGNRIRNEDRLRQHRNEDLLWRALARIQCPTLVVRGSASSILFHEIAGRMVNDVLSSGQLVEINFSGHVVMMDNPGEFGDVVLEFLNDEKRFSNVSNEAIDVS